MSRHEQVHPFLARRLVDMISRDIWCCERLKQVHTGVFIEQEGQRRVLAVLGCAPISEPAENALRESGLLMELAVLQYTDQEPTVYGPSTSFPEATWDGMILGAARETQDVNCMLSMFEVVSAWDMSRRCCLAEASQLVASIPGLDVPDCSTERQKLIKKGGWDFLALLDAELDRAVEEAA